MRPLQLVAERSERNSLAAGSDISRVRHSAEAVSVELPDDLSREVYCLLGFPIDALDMAETIRRIEIAAAARKPFLISTLNLNYLINSRSDPLFRESVLQSDLCPADGMPIIWLARLVGLPIRWRIAGSDIFDALKSKRRSASPLKVFLFGGAEDVATKAGAMLNAAAGGLVCVGTLHPGYGSVEQMSSNAIIDTINASGADFVAVALGAKKGQAWLLRNHNRLDVPVRSHLGATFNFQAGTVRRAPMALRKLGLEWLWRIKEEPTLWRRYAHDGVRFLQLLLTHVLPLVIAARWQRVKYARQSPDLLIKRSQAGDAIMLVLAGTATAAHVEKATAWFRDIVATPQSVVIDLSGVCIIDARFLGCLLMLRKALQDRDRHLDIINVTAEVARTIRHHGAEFLVAPKRGL